MANGKDYVSKYTLMFKDMASKGMLRVSRVAAGMSQGIRRAGTAAAIAGGAAAGAAVAITNRVADRGDEFAKLARQIGLPAEKLQEMEFIADRQGASFQKVTGGLQTFAKRFGELRAGTGGLYSGLQKLDPAFARQLQAAQDSDQAYQMLMDRIASTTDESEKAAIAAAAFSKGNSQAFIRMLDGGMDAYEQLAEQGRRIRPPLGPDARAAMEAYKDSATNASFAMGSLADIVGVGLAPILTVLNQHFTDFIVGNRELIQSKLEGFFERVQSAVAKVDFASIMNAVDRFTAAILWGWNTGDGFVQSIGGWKPILIGLIAVFAVAQIIAFAAAFNPVTVGIAAVVAGGVLLIDNWDKVVQVWNEFKADPVETVKRALVVFWDFVKDLWGWFRQSFPDLATSLEGAAGALKDALVWPFQAMANVAQSAWAGVQSIILGGVNFIIDKINAVLARYNDIANSTAGNFLRLPEIEQIRRLEVASSQVSGGAGSGRLQVEITGQVDGASVEATVSSFGDLDATGANGPLAG